MRLLTQNQARELDKLSTSDYNISDDSLMDMAGKKTADFIHSKFKEIGTQTIAIVCGKGNNGGDGFATALHLDQLNYRVVIFSLFDSQFISKSNKSFHDRCLKKEINICYGFDLPSKNTHFDIVVDAILGIGLAAGGYILVAGGAALAKRLQISSMVIGLTVVAYGTSTPELAASLTAAFNSHTDIILGNIVGSNISNIGMVIGISAMIATGLVIDGKNSK